MFCSQRVQRTVAIIFLLVLAIVPVVLSQAGFEDDRVMLQGFYWESYRHGHFEKFPTYGKDHWYVIVKNVAGTIRAGHFDLIWLPPPSYAGTYSAGYDPREYFRLDNSYGTFNEHRTALTVLLQNGIEPVADIVINHRNGSTGWADFKNPDWGTWAICRTDEAFTNPDSGITNAPTDQRGDCEEEADYRPEGTYGYPDFRDIAHTDPRVRKDIERYLLQLKSLGYRGWRYDMVHGYHAKWVALYNRLTLPTFSVGEYDWDKQAQQRGWIWETSTSPAESGASHMTSSSSASKPSTAETTRRCMGLETDWDCLEIRQMVCLGRIAL
jgi:alpha-amylase